MAPPPSRRTKRHDGHDTSPPAYSHPPMPPADYRPPEAGYPPHPSQYPMFSPPDPYRRHQASSSATRRTTLEEPPWPAVPHGSARRPPQSRPDYRMEQPRAMMDPRERSGRHPMDYAYDYDMSERNEDDFPTVAECNNLGSFAEDSPPRMQGRPPSSARRASPPRAYHPYPSPSPPPPPPPSYNSGNNMSASSYYPPPYGYPYPSATTYHPATDVWPSEEEDRKLPAVARSPTSKKTRNDGSGESSSPSVRTPEKDSSSRKSGRLMRSPFRSPIVERGSSKKYKRSPLFQGTPGGIGNYGSFDHLGASLDELSPMGPSLGQAFGDDPFPFSDSQDAFEPHRSPLADGRRVMERGDRRPSPFSSFVGDLSPVRGSMRLQGSPIQSQEQADFAPPGYGAPVPPPPSAHQQFVPPKPEARRQMMPSPVTTSQQGSAAKRSQQWSSSSKSGSSGLFRLELGKVGSRPGETRRSLEDLNRMLQGETRAPTEQTPASLKRLPPSRHQGAVPSDLTTPIKTRTVTPGTSESSLYPGGYAGSATPMAATTTATTPRFPSTKQPSAEKPTPASTSASSRKETGALTRRIPCNCKKSKCLKLYCECYSAELYCEGCNCTECQNIPEYDKIRAKAMKDTRSKNPHAFKQRIAPSHSPAAGHNIGCKCKRSECLKKYCECFQAGVMCGSKCKCEKCQNYVGSQALIDKRRKMKDHRGAEFAMRVADQVWKGGRDSRRPPRGIAPLASPVSLYPPRRVPPHSMMQPSPSHARGPPPPGYTMMGPPPPPPHPPHHPHHIGYSPMTMQPVTPGYMQHPGSQRRSTQRPERRTPVGSYGDPLLHSTPTISTPRPPALRLGFEPQSNKKKRVAGESEETVEMFGSKNAAQPKKTTVKILSYLSGQDLYRASLVCKRWKEVSRDEGLWQLQ